MMRNNLLTQRALFSLILLVAGFSAYPAMAQTTLRAISCIPKTHPVMTQAVVWVDMVNDHLKGRLSIDYLGGPEVIDRFQQVEALTNGVVDITFSPTSDYQDRLPSVSTFTLSRLSPSQERASGFYQWMVKRHEKINIHYIGRVQAGAFYLWINRQPHSLTDLNGLKMRTGSLYDRFMRKLGMVPVTMNSPEVYTALQRGVVDGFGWPLIGPRQRGWIKQGTCVIDLPFFSASNVVALMNLERWIGLPEELRKQVAAITVDFEPKMLSYFSSMEQREWERLDKLGVVRVKFSDEANREYTDTAYDVEWENIATKVPEDTPELKKLTGN